jgi:hypothetical protein
MRDDDKNQYLAESAPDDRCQPAGLGHRGADQAADQRMRGGRGDAVVPGDDVPGERPHQGAENDVVIDQRRVDRPLADRGGHLELEDPQRGKIEESGKRHGLLGRQCAGRDYRRNRIGAVVKPVHEVEGQRHENKQHQRPHANG